MQDFKQDDIVRVEIENDAPIGGATQLAKFEVDEVHMDRVVGTDPTWGDECVIEGFGTDTLTYRDGGKSGVVDSVEIVN